MKFDKKNYFLFLNHLNTKFDLDQVIYNKVYNKFNLDI